MKILRSIIVLVIIFCFFTPTPPAYSISATHEVMIDAYDEMPKKRRNVALNVHHSLVDNMDEFIENDTGVVSKFKAPLLKTLNSSGFQEVVIYHVTHFMENISDDDVQRITTEHKLMGEYVQSFEKMNRTLFKRLLELSNVAITEMN